MVKNLERFDELSFRNLVGLAAAVNDIIQYGESLGHTLYDIDAQFAETFPGYEPILEDDWLEIFEHRNRRTLDTLRYSLNALNRISWNSIPSQHILEGLAADAEAADGNVEALQAANEFLHHQAGQLAKISQQLSLQTNVQAVYWAYQVDREAADRATTSQWIANGVGEVPPYDSAGGVARRARRLALGLLRLRALGGQGVAMKAVVPARSRSPRAGEPARLRVAANLPPRSSPTATTLSPRSARRFGRRATTARSGTGRRSSRPTLWADAVAYCRTPGNSAAPNCQTVGLVLSTIELEKAAKEAKRQLQDAPRAEQAPGAARRATRRRAGAAPGGQD